MKRVSLCLALLLSLSACGSTKMVDLGFAHVPATTGVTLPALERIADPDHAEVALYIAAKLFEAVVSGINNAHRLNLLPDSRYIDLVSSSNSSAHRTQAALADAWNAVAAWRKGAARVAFDTSYAQFAKEIAPLQKELQ